VGLYFESRKLSIVGRVLAKPPGKASLNQFVIQVSTVREHYLGDGPSVSVFVPRSNRDDVAKGKL